MSKRVTLNLVETVLIGLMIALSTWFGTRWVLERNTNAVRSFAADTIRELAPFERAYSSKRYSRNAEEWLIRDYFADKRGGVFLDVGANHYRDENNTYFLETQLGWSGIAVDALGEFRADYERYRPRTRFVVAFVGDVAGGESLIYVPRRNSLTASEERGFAEREAAEPASPRSVPTITLTGLLDREGLSSIDLVSMDIELAEPKALAGFDIERFKPSLVCVEAHLEVRQQILDYFALHRYVVVSKYLRADPRNLYFMPLTNGAPLQ